VPRLTKIWADQAYQGHNLVEWCLATGTRKSKSSNAIQAFVAGASDQALDRGTHIRLVAT
jgi:hypothetical protein